MAASTGPILAIGAITITNEVIFQKKALDWRLPIATGLAAVAFAGAESFIGPGIPRAVALVGLVAVVLTRVNPSVPSPAESALSWWNSAK